MAAIIICLNFLFELVFKYRFVSKIEVFYFIIAVIICIGTIKKMIRMRNGRYLPAFYDLWPAMIMIISCISLFRLSLLPFVISSFMILLLGRSRKRSVKVIVVGINFIGLIMYISIGVFFFYGNAMFNTTRENIEIVHSSDDKYIMILEEGDLGAIGGYVNIYAGRNIDFGILGCYMPKKIKYRGPWGERPEMFFVNDRLISINGELIDIKGDRYIDGFIPNTYMKAYEAYLRSFPELNDYEYSGFALRDLDKDGVPELMIIQVDEADGILKVYSYDDHVYKIGEYSDPKIGISAIRISDDPKFPGLFDQWWGGGVEHYGYLEVREKRLIYEGLWYIDRTGGSPYQRRVSDNGALISEAMDLFSDDECAGDILEPVLINDENIDKMFSSIDRSDIEDGIYKDHR